MKKEVAPAVKKFNPAKNLGKFHHAKKTSSPAMGGVSDPNGAGQKTRPGY